MHKTGAHQHDLPQQKDQIDGLTDDSKLERQLGYGSIRAVEIGNSDS